MNVSVLSAQTIKVSETTSEISAVFDSNCSIDNKFNNAKEWVAKTFGDYNEAVQFEDKEKGRIIVKGSSLLESESATLDSGGLTILDVEETPYLNFTLTIDFKEDRHRLLFDGISITIDEISTVLYTTETSTEEYNIKDYCNRIVSGETRIPELQIVERRVKKNKKTLDSLNSLDYSTLKSKEIKKIEKEKSSLTNTIKSLENSIDRHYYWANKVERRLKYIEDTFNALIISFNKNVCKSDEW